MSTSLEKILNFHTSRPWGPVPTAADWQQIEGRLGRTMPTDFRMLIDATGGCPMGTCFVRNPAEKENIFISLSHGGLHFIHDQISDIVKLRHNINLYPDDLGYIHVAAVDSVHFCIKPVSDEVVIIDLPAGELRIPKLTFTDLMWNLFTDRDTYDGLGHSMWSIGDPLFSDY